MNNNQFQDPNDVVAAVAQRCDLAKFHEMLTGFFRLRAQGKSLLSRPAIGVRLVDGDFNYAIRPAWVKVRLDPRTYEVTAPGIVNYDKLEIDVTETGTHHGQRFTKGKACQLLLADGGQLYRGRGTWYYRRAEVAMADFPSLVNYFQMYPWQVFSRSTDHCSICGRHLTDDLSRGRGIGPECVKVVQGWFGNPTVAVAPTPVTKAIRTLDDE